jgi:23S rRNA-/tRNA-specific pseudouridylate synthase
VKEEKQKITLSRKVDPYRSGWTVVEYLSHRFKYHTAERWTKRVRDGWVRVNGADVDPGHVVTQGDEVLYTIFHNEPEVDFRYDVVYEDADILAVSKSGNLPVHACGVFIRNTLIAVLKNRYGDSINLAHRLDRETSGLVVLSKNTDAARQLAFMFAEGRVSKTYTSIVHGRVRPEEFEVDAAIGKTQETIALDEGQKYMKNVESDLKEDLPRCVPRRQVDFETGKPARTVFRVERYLDDYTLLEAAPLSGRTNQIRVHLQYIGHPIVGDKVYRLPDCFAATPPIDRQALHCRSLRFNHPITGDGLCLEAPFPEDMRALIERSW